MKKITTIMAMALMAVFALTLTSCEDDEIAYTLEGTWKGDMYVSSTYNGHTYGATYSEICFSRDPYTYASGTGYWVDYYSNAPYDYVANHIDWTVSNSVIYVNFREEGTNIEIRNYSLNDDYFSGRIYSGDNYVDFSLEHTSSPNWNDYDYGWSNYAKKNNINVTRGASSAEMPKRFIRTNK